MATTTEQPSREQELDEVFAGLSGLGLYRDNAFRVTGLPVTATAVQLRRRREEAALNAKLGVPGPDWDTVNAAFEALQHPVVRLVHELLWVWDKDADDDHDYAVRRHMEVLEGPSLIEPGRPDVADDPRARQWLVATNAWAEVLAGEQVWDYARQRVREIADPRLSTGVVRRLRDRLPRHLVTVTAGQALRAAEKSGAKAADRFLWVLDESTFDDDLVDDVLTTLVGPSADRIRAICTTADNTAQAKPAEGVAVGRALVADSARPVRVIRSLLGPEDPKTRTVYDDIARTVNLCVVAQYNRATIDLDALDLLKRAAQMARERTTKELIARNRKALKQGVIVSRVEDLLQAGKPDQAADRLRAWARRTKDLDMWQKIDDVLNDPAALVTRLRNGAPTKSTVFGFGVFEEGHRKVPGSHRFVSTYVLLLCLVIVVPMRSYLRDANYFYGRVPLSRLARELQWLFPLGYLAILWILLPLGVFLILLTAVVMVPMAFFQIRRWSSAAMWAAAQVRAEGN